MKIPYSVGTWVVIVVVVILVSLAIRYFVREWQKSEAAREAKRIQDAQEAWKEYHLKCVLWFGINIPGSTLSDYESKDRIEFITANQLRVNDGLRWLVNRAQIKDEEYAVCRNTHPAEGQDEVEKGKLRRKALRAFHETAQAVAFARYIGFRIFPDIQEGIGELEKVNRE